MGEALRYSAESLDLLEAVAITMCMPDPLRDVSKAEFVRKNGNSIVLTGRRLVKHSGEWANFTVRRNVNSLFDRMHWSRGGGDVATRSLAVIAHLFHTRFVADGGG